MSKPTPEQERKLAALLTNIAAIAAGAVGGPAAGLAVEAIGAMVPIGAAYARGEEPTVEQLAAEDDARRRSLANMQAAADEALARADNPTQA